MTDAVAQFNTAPTVAIIGLGGCGINLVRRTVAAHPFVSDFATVRYFDASSANASFNKADVGIIGDGHGSGKERPKLRKEIGQHLAGLDVRTIAEADVYILVFSLSGASGNTIATYFIEALKKSDKAVVAIAVGDNASLKAVRNTLASLETLHNLSSNNNFALPISFFYNGFGQPVVDTQVPSRISDIVKLLTFPAKQVDLRDRVGWVTGSREARGGIKLLSTIAAIDGSVPEVLSSEVSARNAKAFDSILTMGVVDPNNKGSSISPKDTHGKPVVMLFEGLFVQQSLPEGLSIEPMQGVITSSDETLGMMISDLSRQKTAMEAATSTDSSLGKLFGNTNSGSTFAD